MTASISTAAYAPNGQPPTNPQELQRYLQAELNRISAAIKLLAAGHLDTTYFAPAKPRDGDVRLADGTHWNPGSGQGFYGYYASAWHLLG